MRVPNPNEPPLHYIPVQYPDQHQVLPQWVETLGILGGLAFVAILLCVLLYVMLEIMGGGRQERQSNDDLEEYLDEIQHDQFYNQEEDVQR